MAAIQWSAALATFLRAYQLDAGYTPGPLFLLATAASLLGSLGAARRRATPAQRRSATACLVMFLAAVSVLLGSDVFEFSWRYQLPALVTLVPACALGMTAVAGDLAARRGGPARPPGPALTPGPAAALGGSQPGLQAKDRTPAVKLPEGARR